jgi:hypothetical protein
LAGGGQSRRGAGCRAADPRIGSGHGWGLFGPKPKLTSKRDDPTAPSREVALQALIAAYPTNSPGAAVQESRLKSVSPYGSTLTDY